MLASTSIAWPSTRNGGSSACWIFHDDASPRRPGRCSARQDPELVAAEPRDRVAVAQAADEPLGDELEEHVAVLVAERVVDLLELVEVHDQERQRLARPQRRADRVVDAVPEQDAVGQAGEVVVQRLVLERLGVGLALGDVAQAADVDRAGARAPRRSGRAPSGTSSRPCGGRPTRRRGRASAAGSRSCSPGSASLAKSPGASGRPSSRTAARSPPARCSRTARPPRG